MVYRGEHFIASLCVCLSLSLPSSCFFSHLRALREERQRGTLEVLFSPLSFLFSFVWEIFLIILRILLNPSFGAKVCHHLRDADCFFLAPLDNQMLLLIVYNILTTYYFLRKYISSSSSLPISFLPLPFIFLLWNSIPRCCLVMEIFIFANSRKQIMITNSNNHVLSFSPALFS